MARLPRTGPRTPTSPGRGKPRPHGRRGTGGSTSTKQPEKTPKVKRPREARGFRITRRAVALFVVFALLAASYANSLRIYFDQDRQIAQARAEIRQRTESISALDSELKRWQDPAYVKAQARTRLGWVMPGEVGYRVIGADGKPIGNGAQIDREGSMPAGEEPPTWYESMWGSVEAADHPAPR